MRAQFNFESVTISIHDWWKIQDDLAELDTLRVFRKEQAARDREYLQWSLGDGPLKNVLALVQVGREIEKEATT